MFHNFHSLLFNLFQKTKYTLTSCVFRCCLTGLSLCLTHIFIFHNITTCQERQPFSCLLLLLTHITLKWSKRKGCRQTTECLTMLAFQNYISCFPKHQSPGQSFGAFCRTQRDTGWENQIWFNKSDWIQGGHHIPRPFWINCFLLSKITILTKAIYRFDAICIK